MCATHLFEGGVLGGGAAAAPEVAVARDGLEHEAAGKGRKGGGDGGEGEGAEPACDSIQDDWITGFGADPNVLMYVVMHACVAARTLSRTAAMHWQAQSMHCLQWVCGGMHGMAWRTLRSA